MNSYFSNFDAIQSIWDSLEEDLEDVFTDDVRESLLDAGYQVTQIKKTSQSSGYWSDIVSIILLVEDEFFLFVEEVPENHFMDSSRYGLQSVSRVEPVKTEHTEYVVVEE